MFNFFWFYFSRVPTRIVRALASSFVQSPVKFCAYVGRLSFLWFVLGFCFFGRFVFFRFVLGL